MGYSFHESKMVTRSPLRQNNDYKHSSVCNFHQNSGMDWQLLPAAFTKCQAAVTIDLNIVFTSLLCLLNSEGNGAISALKAGEVKPIRW